METSKPVTKDPICGMSVDESTALSATRDGQTFYFFSGLSKDERADIRCQKIGFVFRGFNLLSRDYVAESR